MVLALIIVAPEVLLGRRTPERGTPPAQNPEDGAPLQTFSIELDTSRADPATVPEVPAAAAAEVAAVPPPVTEDAPPLVGAPAPEPKTAAGADGGPQAQQPARPGAPSRSSAAAASGSWWVQVGSFSSNDNAKREAQKLRDAGYTTQVSATRRAGKDLYRVWVGPVADREAAMVLRARLVAAGLSNPTLVAP